MATDIDAIVNNLSSFFDMKGKSVIHVGAGGGQFINYAFNVRRVVAVDPDPTAILLLKDAIQRSGLEDRFKVVQGEFSSLSTRADVVLFEFCLHEMDNPAEALRHAQSLAPEILILDHIPESPWAWYACDEKKAARSWAAVRELCVVREASFKATQYFPTYQQLLLKIGVLGEEAIARIQEFSEQEDIRIRMEYAMALLRRDAA